MVILFLALSFGGNNSWSYPIDGYGLTRIRRLLYLQMVKSGQLSGTLPREGGMLELADIRLNLTGPRGDARLQRLHSRGGASSLVVRRLARFS